ncbi:L-2-amino-thiazoline-4-carboxylic acid hydrolase [Thermodesulfobacteriota bacterium]
MEKSNREKAMSSHAKEEGKQVIEDYLDQMKLDDAVPVEEFRRVVRALIGARGRFLYFVWKVLKEKGLDATALVQEASFRWGEFNGKKMGDIKTPADFMTKLSSKAGTLAWDQEYTILDDQKASKEFSHCPLVATFEDVGASKEEIAVLCKEMLCYGDYGMASPHPINLEWAEPTIGEGNKRCVMMITPKKDE